MSRCRNFHATLALEYVVAAATFHFCLHTFHRECPAGNVAIHGMGVHSQLAARRRWPLHGRGSDVYDQLWVWGKTGTECCPARTVTDSPPRPRPRTSGRAVPAAVAAPSLSHGRPSLSGRARQGWISGSRAGARNQFRSRPLAETAAAWKHPHGNSHAWYTGHSVDLSGR